jgi:hypothetical protein
MLDTVGTDPTKVRELFEKAHKYCFIGLSITSGQAGPSRLRAARPGSPNMP